MTARLDIPSSWLRTFIVLLITLPILLVAAMMYGPFYIDTLMPLYRWMLTICLPDYNILNLSLARMNGEPVVAATVLAIREQVVEGHRLPPGFTIDVSTLAAHAYKHVIVLILAGLIWPNLSLTQRLSQLLISIPVLLAIEMLDIPLVLASAVRDLVTVNIAPNVDAQSWLIDWTHVMDGGGRWVISIAAAFLAAHLRGLLVKH